MRVIKSKKDWDDFIADVQYHLGEDGNYRDGSFAVSQNNDDWDGRFFTEFMTDTDGFSTTELGLRGLCQSVWETPDQFYDGLLGNYHTPFFIVDTGANYSWL